MVKHKNSWLLQQEDNENYDLRKDSEFNDNCLMACKIDSFPLKARAAQMTFPTATQQKKSKKVAHLASAVSRDYSFHIEIEYTVLTGCFISTSSLPAGKEQYERHWSAGPVWQTVSLYTHHWGNNVHRNLERQVYSVGTVEWEEREQTRCKRFGVLCGRIRLP